jgi:hypothetical protein
MLPCQPSRATPVGDADGRKQQTRDVRRRRVGDALCVLGGATLAWGILLIPTSVLAPCAILGGAVLAGVGLIVAASTAGRGMRA